MDRDAIILGGGIIGVTTAIVFRSMGYNVEIISEQFLWEASSDPAFASIYPAASVIPHSVGGHTKDLYEKSYSVFKQIARSYPDIVRTQKHLELTEGGVEQKDYFEWVDAQPIPSDGLVWGIPVPKREEALKVEGIGFDILFVEMPLYKQFLKEKIQKLGIRITHKKVNRPFFEEISSQGKILCNCLGINGPFLVEDAEEMQGLAGILVSCPIERLLKNAETETPVSYNYHFNGIEAYSYPRTRDVLFGGTRIPVDLNSDPVQQLRKYLDKREIPYRLMNDIPVPEHILSVNKELYRQLYNVDVSIDSARAILGLRPVREGGVRLDVSEDGAVNSYGYGGAGVTLSWGAALEVGRLVDGCVDFTDLIMKTTLL